MQITSREKTKDGKMVRIYLDNRYGFSIPQEIYITSFLYERDEVTEEEITGIKENELVLAAREKAVRFLTAKDRTEHELFERLKESGFDQDIAQKAVDALKTIGYVDDSRFVLKYASDRMKNKVLSKKALKFELEQKGVNSELIKEVLVDFEQDEEEIAMRAARKKFGKYDLNNPEIERKMLSFLAHRGFSYETSRSVLSRIKAIEE